MLLILICHLQFFVRFDINSDSYVYDLPYSISLFCPRAPLPPRVPAPPAAAPPRRASRRRGRSPPSPLASPAPPPPPFPVPPASPPRARRPGGPPPLPSRLPPRTSFLPPPPVSVVGPRSRGASGSGSALPHMRPPMLGRWGLVAVLLGRRRCGPSAVMPRATVALDAAVRPLAVGRRGGAGGWRHSPTQIWAHKGPI